MTSTNILPLHPALDPDVVLDNAKGAYESVLILGYDHEGRINARASLNLKRSDILWIIESFKRDTLFNGDEDS